MKKVAAGDQVAFSELYTVWEPHLSSFIFRITRSKELTAEVVQDIFLKIWMSRETLSEIYNFKSFLFAIGRNQAINTFRKAMRELKHSQDLEKALKNNSNKENDENDLIQLSLVDEAIDHLPPRQKEIYLLHRHKKLTYHQIAEKLGIGKESVKTHLKIAVKSISKFIRTRIEVTLLFIGIF
jgi:RNA polymerase sigma-70 factor (family 1)